MAKAIKTVEAPNVAERGKIKRLTIRNFRCIGPEGVSVDIDDIVVLVGPNNSGKSSILRAYEIAMRDGAKDGYLKIEDFPNATIKENTPTEIELLTEITEGAPGAMWLADENGNKWDTNSGGPKFVREKWVWTAPGPGKRSGWNVENQAWDDKVPWGLASVANSRRPRPHPIRAFDPPEAQAKQIHELLKSALVASAKEITNEDGEKVFDKLLKDLNEFQQLAIEKSKADFDSLEQKLNEIVSSIFADHIVKYSPAGDADEKSFTLFAGAGKLTMGHNEGHQTALEYQGSGARRTMLWATLRYLVESTSDQTRSNVLLIDEPELCLHPSSIRQACQVLYDLASKSDWQVMVTTHSPVFIDLSRDNTTVVRVERLNDGTIQGTTLFRPDTAELGSDDRENLKLLNIYDPYVAEFFFGGNVVVVEGDTEYSAFRLVADADDKFKNCHVIRARGKATIASLSKILNQFGTKYSILHDSDMPTIEVTNKKTGEQKTMGNPAWGANQTIRSAVEGHLQDGTVRLVASIGNFESAYFDTQLSSEKPYGAVASMLANEEKFAHISNLLHALIDHTVDLPEGCVSWINLDELKDKVTQLHA